MLRSKWSRNAAESSLVRASAAALKTFRMSAEESANATIEISSSAVRMSGPVTGVDVDVLFGEVASPETRAAAAGSANGEADGTIGQVELGLQFVLGEFGGEAAAAHRNTLH